MGPTLKCIAVLALGYTGVTRAAHWKLQELTYIMQAWFEIAFDLVWNTIWQMCTSKHAILFIDTGTPFRSVRLSPQRSLELWQCCKELLKHGIRPYVSPTRYLSFAFSFMHIRQQSRSSHMDGGEILYVKGAFASRCKTFIGPSSEPQKATPAANALNLEFHQPLSIFFPSVERQLSYMYRVGIPW